MISEKNRQELLTGAYGLVSEDVPLKDYTNFHIGGPCEILVEPTSEKELLRAVRFLRAEKIPYYVLGNGSNILVRDGGFRGVVIHLGRQFSDCIIDGTKIRVQAGALLSKVAELSFRAGLTGMEEISGIPGSVGGCTAMNAGAYGGEMKDVISRVRAINPCGEVVTYDNAELDFSYRSSRLLKEGDLVLEVEFSLKEGDPKAIRAAFEDYDTRRRTKQPLEDYSAGSTFKRPVGGYASQLIDEAGLRGFSIGRAQVSEKHCGFLINQDNASAKDVLALIAEVQRIVKEKFGIALEPEVRIIGED